MPRCERPRGPGQHDPDVSEGTGKDRKGALPQAAKGKGSNHVLTPFPLGAILCAVNKYCLEVLVLRLPKGTTLKKGGGK